MSTDKPSIDPTVFKIAQKIVRKYFNNFTFSYKNNSLLLSM